MSKNENRGVCIGLSCLRISQILGFGKGINFLVPKVHGMSCFACRRKTAQ